jgi:hypothetical protein
MEIQRGVMLVLLVVMVMMMNMNMVMMAASNGSYLEPPKPLYIIGIEWNSGRPLAG